MKVKVRGKRVYGMPVGIALGAIALLSASQPASAQSSISSSINNIITLLSGNTLLAIATLAIMVVGFLWMTGRLEAMRAVAIAVGIGIAGSAASIASTLIGSS